MCVDVLHQVLGQDEQLREAARSGDVALIQSWPPGDAAINKTGQGGWTALHFAAREGGCEVRPATSFRDFLFKSLDGSSRSRVLPAAAD